MTMDRKERKKIARLEARIEELSVGRPEFNRDWRFDLGYKQGQIDAKQGIWKGTDAQEEEPNQPDDAQDPVDRH